MRKEGGSAHSTFVQRRDRALGFGDFDVVGYPSSEYFPRVPARPASHYVAFCTALAVSQLTVFQSLRRTQEHHGDRTCARHALPRPWGVVDLGPWSPTAHNAEPIGEIWYERPDKPIPDAFASAQAAVHERAALHPGPSGRCLCAVDRDCRTARPKPGTSSAPRPAPKSRSASIGVSRTAATRGRRRRHDLLIVSFGGPCIRATTVFVPAGTIHAIGAGLVIAEIQQRSDATFRLFDYGRQRELHMESAIAVADPGPARARERQNRLGNERTLLVPAPTSCWKGSIWRRTQLGAWKRNGRPGFWS